MKYSVERSVEILERTPAMIKTLPAGIDEVWVMNNEGPQIFSP